MTTKKTDPTFWTAKPSEAPESWEGMLAYFKPRTTEELHSYFDAKPPAPPDPNERPPEVEHRRPTLFDQLHLTEEEFVELALSQPQMWEDEELDYLHLAAEEGETDERLEGLANIYFSGVRHSQKAKRTTPPPTPSLNTSLSDMPGMPGITTIPDLDVLEGTKSVDRWWEKQKG